MKNNLEAAFEKVEKKKRDSGAGPKKKVSATRLGGIIGLGLGLVLSLNLGIYLQTTQIESARTERLQTLSQQRAEIAGQATASYIKGMWERIAFFTKKPTLNASMAMADAQALDRSKKAIIAQTKGAQAVRFVAKGSAELDPQHEFPIRFTELEMIRRAERREAVLPEAAKINNQWRINFVAPMPNDANQDVIGVMMLSLSIDELRSLVLQNQVSLGQMDLLQKFGSQKALSVFSAGQGGAGAAVEYPVENSYWKIQFSPSYAMLENAKVDANLIYLIIVVASLLLSGGLFFVGRIAGVKIEQRLVSSAEAESTETKQSTDKAHFVDPLYQKTDFLDVDIAVEDEGLLGLDDVEQSVPPEEKLSVEEDILEIADDPSVPDVIFRAYDIRGLADKQIDKSLAQFIGQAVGSEAIDAGQDTLIVARDARLSSPELTEFLIRGILSSGCNVLNIGTVPTPLMYFATATLKESQSGVMVTASHNPGEYNGFKIVMNGKSRSADDIKAIRRRILKRDLYEGQGQESRHDIVPDYIDTIFSDVALAGDVSIVIDAGNGVTGTVAPKLFEELGCHVVPLFCDLDGNFPNHSPDPSVEENLQELIAKVKESDADLGVAFDGDGDRVIVVTSSGQIIWPDQLLMLFAKDIVSRNPGADVVFDVKSTKHLAASVTGYGGRPIMWKTGHAPMKSKMLETGALLGGEYSGHIFIKDRWFGFDDGMYAAARLIEILSLQGESLDMMFEEFPKSPATPEIRVPVSEEKKFEIVAEFADKAEFGDGRVTTIDGVRVDFPDGWGLVRASNTSANLTLRFEADNEESLHKVKSIVAQELKKVDNSLQINWNA